ncbi:MAG: DUF4017 family protein [Kurthia sp.]|nr:DUF4017 family protein [Candidatus Kurthia equi]
MKTIKLSISVYFITLCIALLLPTSSEYATFAWKLIISQIYAIPALLLTMLLCIIFRSSPFIEERQE